MKKLHHTLLQNFKMYAVWHGFRFHPHVHWLGFFLSALFIGLALHNLIEKTYFVVPVAEAATNTVIMPGHFMTPFDKVPDFAVAPTVTSVKNGNWTDASVWSTGTVPGANDVVVIKHSVTYNSMTGIAKVIAVDPSASFNCATNQSVRLSVGTFQVKPAGKLECIVPAQFTAEFVIRDIPINTANDPSQYGIGILAIDAAVKLQGASITETFVRLSGEPSAGSRTLTLSQTPTGWKAGDEVIVPDTRQLGAGDYPQLDRYEDNVRRAVTQSEKRTIQSISGSTITLSAPLTYNHKGARDPDGVLTNLLPHVGNLTRNITIRSENPNGTRGHVFLTRASDIDVRYVQFKNLGRTTSANVDSATYDANGNATHIGTNQIGRYPLHIHHVPGVCPAKDYQFKVIGNSIEDGRKWSMTIHGSHYGLIKDNVIYDATGSAIATEDGSETGNVFDHNFLVKIEANIKMNGGEGGDVQPDGQGRKGNGFWFRGPASIVINNVVADTREGIGYYTGSDETGPTSPGAAVRLPKFPCADTQVAGQYNSAQVQNLTNDEFNNNEIYSTSQFAFGTWFFNQSSLATRHPFKNLTIWHAARTAMFLRYWDGTFDGLRILNEGGVGAGIAQFNNPTFFLSLGMGSLLKNADIQGTDVLYQRIGQLSLAAFWTVEDSFFRNRVGFALNATGQSNQNAEAGGESRFVFNNVKFEPLPGKPLVSVMLTEDGFDFNNTPKVFLISRYQGNASKNYRLYYPSQVAPNGKYGAIAPCTTTNPEFPGAFVCPISALPSPAYPTPYATPAPNYATPYATPYGTPSTYPTPPAIVNGWQEKVYDEFAGDCNAKLASHTPIFGSAWVLRGSTDWDMCINLVRNINAGVVENTTALENDQAVEAIMHNRFGTEHLVSRFHWNSGKWNGYVASATGTPFNNIVLYRADNGALTPIASQVWNEWADGTLLRLETEGSNIKLLINGVVKLSTTDSTYPSGTSAMYASSSSGGIANSFDSFKAYEKVKAAPSAPSYGTPYATPYGTPYNTPTSSYSTPYGTPYATPASNPLTITGDLNKDGIVNSLDWSVMNARWFTNNAEADLNHDGIVNTIDFSILNVNWFRRN